MIVIQVSQVSPTRPERAEAPISSTPCFTLIEQALSAFLTLIMFNEPWILSDVVYVIEFTFFHEGEYDSSNLFAMAFST